VIATALVLVWLALLGAWAAVGRSLGPRPAAGARRVLPLVVATVASAATAQPVDSLAVDSVAVELAVPPPVPVDPAGVRRVTLAEALALAAETSPALALARADVAEAEGRALQTTLRPNPTVSGELIPLAPLGGGPFDVEATVGASLYLERPSLREARLDAATGATRAAEARVEAEALRLRADVARAYVEAAVAEARTATLAEVAAVVREAVRSAEFRYAEGELSGFSLRRLRVEQARYETALAEAALDGALARRQLSALALSPEALADGAVLAPAETLTGPAPSVLVTDALAAAARPEVLAARAELEAALAGVEAVRLGARPAPTVSAGLTRQPGGGVGPAVGVSLPLALYDRREGDVQAALARVEGARARLALAERAVQADVRRAFEAFDARRQRAALLRGGLLDGADDLLRIARVAYGLDEISLVELLDATDAYREARVAVAAAEAAAALAYLDLRRAAGGALPALTLTPRTP
jgi:cobalt-zinc-cadmium efflux system outer membrane protein